MHVFVDGVLVSGGSRNAIDGVGKYDEGSASATIGSSTAVVSLDWRCTTPMGGIRVGCVGGGSPSIMRSNSAAAS